MKLSDWWLEVRIRAALRRAANMSRASKLLLAEAELLYLDVKTMLEKRTPRAKAVLEARKLRRVQAANAAFMGTKDL